MSTILLVCGITILILVLIFIVARIWYHRPTGYHKGNELYDNRREDFIKKIREEKDKKDK